MENSLEDPTQCVQDALYRHGLDTKVTKFQKPTGSSQEAADTIGCEVGQIAKTLIFKGKQSGRAICIIASGKNRVDKKKIQAYLGEKIEMPDAEYVLKHTGFSIGGVSPLGYQHDMPPLVDEDIMQYDTVWAAAGTSFASFQISPENLVKITNGKVLVVKK